MAILTFVDSCVLIDAYRGEHTRKVAALAVLQDPTRNFVASPFIKLEVHPSCRDLKEITFYDTYFRGVSVWVADFERMVNLAHEEIARNSGLAVMDALHIAAAVLAKSDVLLTLESRHKPMYRTTLVRVAHLLDTSLTPATADPNPQ